MPESVLPRPGQPFPELAFDTLDQGRIRLADLPGWRLLVVYRGKHCPLCVGYLNTLDSLFDDFGTAGISVFALSADPVERARSQQAEHGWRFPIGYGLSVEDMRRIGLFVSAPRSPQETDRPFAEPGTYLLNPRGELQIVDVSNAPFARPDLAGLLAGIKFIRDHDYPVRGTL